MFETFIEETKGGDYSLVVVNRSSPEPLQRMMEDLFTGQEIDVEELERETDEDDLVLLLEDGEIVASSPLVELQNSILLVNSDLYITGTKGIKDLHLPDVIENLDDIPFYLRGYPESNKEKLLLIALLKMAYGVRIIEIY